MINDCGNDPDPEPKHETVNLYHGTNADFEEFENDYICTEDSVDQYGSGFYFYDEENSSKTVLHGDIQVKVKALIKNSIDFESDELELTKNQIYSLICASPDLENRLWNFGDIDFEGFDNVLESAINTHIGIHWLDSLNMIGNDFFDGKDTHILLSWFAKETGFNCITDKKRGIHVMLKKSDFQIVSKRNEEH